MEAPLCKICGERHWAREPHVSKTKVKPTAKAVKAKR